MKGRAKATCQRKCCSELSGSVGEVAVRLDLPDVPTTDCRLLVHPQGKGPGRFEVGVAPVHGKVLLRQSSLRQEVVVVVQLLSGVRCGLPSKRHNTVAQDRRLPPVLPVHELEVDGRLALNHGSGPQRESGHVVALTLRSGPHGDHSHAHLADVVGGEPLVRLVVSPDGGGHGDDAAVLVLLHVRHAELHEVEVATGVDGGDEVVLLDRGLLDSVPPECGGVQDDNVNPPELSDGIVDTLLDSLRLPEIHFARERVNTKCTHLLRNTEDRPRKLGGRFGALCRDNNVAAPASEGKSTGTPDTAGRTGDDGNAALEVGVGELRALGHCCGGDCSFLLNSRGMQ
eukprot:Hpha_TRINITY_DN16074_c1_g3::TRINITY_DN16074_c1_g3_i1::g.119542::m.119542